MVMEMVNEKNTSGYVVLINAINKYTGNSTVIGFADNIEDADYINRTLHFKTFNIQGNYVYLLQYIPVVGDIGDELSLVYIGDKHHNVYRPIYGYPEYNKAQEKAKEIQENTNYWCAINYINKLDKKWADNFKKPLSSWD